MEKIDFDNYVIQDYYGTILKIDYEKGRECIEIKLDNGKGVCLTDTCSCMSEYLKEYKVGDSVLVSFMFEYMTSDEYDKMYSDGFYQPMILDFIDSVDFRKPVWVDTFLISYVSEKNQSKTM